MGTRKYGFDPGVYGFPPWNPDGRYPMPVLTEEMLVFICFGRTDPVTKMVSGGHIRDALPHGGSKKQHSEFPADWTPETVREAFYYVIQNTPIFKENRLEFTGAFRGVEIRVECFFDISKAVADQVHMYPFRGPGVRLWKNGREVKVIQKYRK